MTATAEPTPPPAPQTIAVPLLSPESFEGLVAVVETLATVADMTQEGLRLEVAPQLDQAIRMAGSILARVEREHDKLADASLYAWAARASGLAVFAANLAAKILAELTDRHHARASAGLVGPDGVTPAAAAAQPVLVDLQGRPMPPRPTLPPHLQAAIAAHHAPPAPAFRAPDFITVESLGPDRVRVACSVCQLAAGEVGVDVAQAVIDTHVLARHGAGRPAGEQLAWLHPKVADPGPGPYDVPTCRRCYCTQANACVRALDSTDGETQTCSWAELNPETNAGVCSACAE